MRGCGALAEVLVEALAGWAGWTGPLREEMGSGFSEGMKSMVIGKMTTILVKDFMWVLRRTLIQGPEEGGGEVGVAVELLKIEEHILPDLYRERSRGDAVEELSNLYP